jgi:hypothetical protein
VRAKTLDQVSQQGEGLVAAQLAGGEVDDVKLGGADFDTLYISCNGRLFSRKINAKGILSSQPPVKPPKPGL